MQVRDPSGSNVAQLSQGSLFGEIPMILGFRSSVEITAVTACDLFVLDKGSLDEVRGLSPCAFVVKSFCLLDIVRGG